MDLNPYLSFNGQCEEAFKFYEKHLSGKITFSMTYGAAPGHETIPPEWSKRIMHVTLSLGDRVLQGADAPPGQYQKPQGFSLALNFKDAAEADRVFNALAENGTVQMPLQETFWALRFGALADQFGISWMVNCEKAA
jgi:PhnB protein